MSNVDVPLPEWSLGKELGRTRTTLCLCRSTSRPLGWVRINENLGFHMRMNGKLRMNGNELENENERGNENEWENEKSGAEYGDR